MKERSIHQTRSAHNNETPALSDDTVDLLELWHHLKQRKKMIGGIVLATFAGALIYLWFTTPLYETRATLKIGKVLVRDKDGMYREKFFDEAKSIKEYLAIKYDTEGKYRDKNILAYIQSVSIPKKTEGYVTVTALGPDNNRSREMLMKAIGDILDKHRRYHETILQKKRDALEATKKKIEYALTVSLPRMRKSLELLKNIETKKLEEKIQLVRTVDIKRIEDAIEFFRKHKIPALREKIAENEKEIVTKQSDIDKMRASLAKVASEDPALAAMTAMRVATLQNDIARLTLLNIDFRSKIRQIEEENIPDLEGRKKRIVKETIPGLEAQKRRLLEETIPAKEAQIQELVEITVPALKNRLRQIETSMNPPYLSMTEIVGKVYEHNRPVKPKTGLILAASLVAGAIFGIFVALFVSRLKRKRQES